MDFWNNHQGRTISEQNSGATPIELTAIITDAFNGGLLRYLSPLVIGKPEVQKTSYLILEVRRFCTSSIIISISVISKDNLNNEVYSILCLDYAHLLF
jgi:hypothetical protein